MIIGNYVSSYEGADMGMLDGASLNAPYPFHWVYLKAVEADELVCVGAGNEMRLPIRRHRRGRRAQVPVNDPIFGPTLFIVEPFLQRDGRPIGGALGL